MDKSQIGLAGEFLVLAQLTQRGYVATITMGNTKGVDILVTNPELNTLYIVEVKTTTKKPRKELLFGEEPCYSWAMSKKHEDIVDRRLIYCFVYLSEPTEMPKFFTVPSRIVAEYVGTQHQLWLSTRKKKVKDTTMRNFRIEVSDPNDYSTNWDLFQK